MSTDISNFEPSSHHHHDISLLWLLIKNNLVESTLVSWTTNQSSSGSNDKNYRLQRITQRVNNDSLAWHSSKE